MRTFIGIGLAFAIMWIISVLLFYMEGIIVGYVLRIICNKYDNTEKPVNISYIHEMATWDMFGWTECIADKNVIIQYIVMFPCAAIVTPILGISACIKVYRMLKENYTNK